MCKASVEQQRILNWIAYNIIYIYIIQLGTDTEPRTNTTIYAWPLQVFALYT